MQDAQNNVISNEYRNVPISILVESATNPRKRFDEKNLEELAASMKAQGILAPLLVRELEESKYEVVAGARRLRAANLAELETIPVRVVKLTDAESIEADERSHIPAQRLLIVAIADSYAEQILRSGLGIVLDLGELSMLEKPRGERI